MSRNQHDKQRQEAIKNKALVINEETIQVLSSTIMDTPDLIQKVWTETKFITEALCQHMKFVKQMNEDLQNLYKTPAPRQQRIIVHVDEEVQIDPLDFFEKEEDVFKIDADSSFTQDLHILSPEEATRF